MTTTQIGLSNRPRSLMEWSRSLRAVRRLIVPALTALLTASSLTLCGSALAAEVRVMCSGGFAAALRELTPEFERETHNSIIISWGPSMGSTNDAIPVRLSRGETADVLIMVRTALDQLAERHALVPDSEVDLALSKVGLAVRSGAPRPDIRTVDALRHVLLDARSIAYSDSASGVYVSTELFRKLGIADQLKAKSRMIPGEPVGAVIARGDAEIGFQQISELLAVKGVDVIGPIPDEVQSITVFSAGISQFGSAPDAARKFIEFLSSPRAEAAIERSGLVTARSGSAK
ncbi:MAG: substrate-binding domain-containing protein [Burkholderiaceae bacterium]